MMTKKVSVIIPVYNCERFIRDAVESALNQTHPHIEVIVVDDGSTDGTAKILDGFISRQKVKCLRQENAGSASARNCGLENATGEYIAFLDSDDIWHDKYIEKQLLCFDADPDAAIVFCNEYSITVPGEPLKTPAKLKDGEGTGAIFDKLLSGCFTTPSTVIIKREVAEAIGFFNTSIIYNEDWEFLLRAAMRFRMVYQPEYLVTRRNHPGSKTSGYYYPANKLNDVYLSVRTGLDKKRARLFRAQNVKRCWKSIAWLFERGHFKAGLMVFLKTAMRHPPFILKLPAVFKKGAVSYLKREYNS